MSGTGKRYRALSARERAFCRHFVAGGTGKDAAIKGGFATRGAKQQAYKLLQRQQVLDEIGRLHAVHAKAVDQALTGALTGGAHSKVDQVPLEMRANVNAEVVGLVDRNFALAALVTNLEVALGRRQITVTRTHVTKDGGRTIENVAVYRPDCQAANRAAEILIRHLPIAAPSPDGPDIVDPQVMAVITGFRAVVAGYAERRSAAGLDQKLDRKQATKPTHD